ncbi:MAG: hypothetical protein OT477_15850 [Chloroflexi bacterium]|nr:hypothetical protein [Chloroflexota bacterium]
MQTYYTETTVLRDQTITLKGIPFAIGDKVEIIILNRTAKSPLANRYPLRGKPIRYDDPFEGVAVDDWEVDEEGA